MKAILNEWQGDHISQLSVDAAQEIGDSRLLPHLQEFLTTIALEDDPVFRERIEDAMVSDRPSAIATGAPALTGSALVTQFAVP